MDNLVIEAKYPISFRKEDAEMLGKYLQEHHSVSLVGMKRVGISNFLRFFLYHKDIIPTYISKTDKHLFIPVDLNDLVEREIFPFWVLTLKRIADAVKYSDLFDVATKKEIEAFFLNGIQSNNFFLLTDYVRKSILRIIESNVFPTIFFLRFDRIKDAVTSEFFDNLQGLKDATHQKMSYVFTSYRGLDKLAPAVFTKSSRLLFTHEVYIKPARREDVEVVCDIYQAQYTHHLAKDLRSLMLDIVDGYMQYLQLALIALREQKLCFKTKEELFHFLAHDEQINLQSEELWESLEPQEQEVLQKVIQGTSIDTEKRKMAKYIWDTGLVTEDKAKSLPAGRQGKHAIFSMLFSSYIKERVTKKIEASSLDFTKKEHMLFQFLKEHQDQICDRESIINAVWKDAENIGVSDWAIDRLVARVRSKLKRQKSNVEVQTVKTRGYKLVSSV